MFLFSKNHIAVPSARVSIREVGSGCFCGSNSARLIRSVTYCGGIPLVSMIDEFTVMIWVDAQLHNAMVRSVVHVIFFIGFIILWCYNHVVVLDYSSSIFVQQIDFGDVFIVSPAVEIESP